MSLAAVVKGMAAMNQEVGGLNILRLISVSAPRQADFRISQMGTCFGGGYGRGCQR